MYYTQEQIDRANQADLVSFLQSQGEQTENNPMVDGGHVFTERGRGEIAEQREKRLKSAEPEGGFERVEAAQFFDGEAFADGNGERVHRYGNGYE